jgi:hypothetical protein
MIPLIANATPLNGPSVAYYEALNDKIAAISGFHEYLKRTA